MMCFVARLCLILFFFIICFLMLLRDFIYNFFLNIEAIFIIVYFITTVMQLYDEREKIKIDVGCS